MTSRNRNSTKTRPAYTGNSKTKPPSKSHEALGCLGLPLTYEDPPIPGVEGLGLDDPKRAHLEFEHATTLAPGESWLTLPGFQDRIDQPPSHPKSAAQHAADGERMYWWEVERRKDSVFRQQERDAAKAAGQPDPYPGPLPPIVADSSNRHLVGYLQITLDAKGWEAAHPAQAAAARRHPDWSGRYRSHTWAEVVEEMGWTGDFLAGAHKLAEDMGLLKQEQKKKQKEERMDDDDDDGPDHGDFDNVDAEEGDDDIVTKAKKRIKARTNKKLPLHIKVANVFIGSMKTGVRLQRFNDAESRSLHMWKYENGLWSWLPDRSVAKWLTPQLQFILNVYGCEKHSSVKQLNEAVQHVIRHELVCVDKDYCFDQHGKVPTRDGLIDPITFEVEPLKPGHFATWVLPKVKYDKNAKCPNWLQMLNDALSDKPKEERKLDIQLIQEWMGMSLVDVKPKALQRALILLGLGDTGKTSLQQVMAGMLSSTWITTPLSALSGAHGTQSFIKRAPWVLGEAFTTSIWHLADVVKMILGGDNIDINPKNKDAICVKPNAPAIWATNHPPKFKEPTRAIVERIVMLELTKVFDKTKPIGVAVAAAKINPGWWPHDLVLNTERAGVLNWMLEGAKRALDRGHYINTRAGEALLEGILDDSNVARAFNKDCIEFDSNAMISAPDYRAALVQWWEEHHGDDIKPPNATMIGVHLKALGDPRILQDKETFKDENGLRFYLGIKLNTAGLSHWVSASFDNRQSGHSTKASARTSSSEKAVTRLIKDNWLKLPEVVTMQKAHRKDG